MSNDTLRITKCCSINGAGIIGNTCKRAGCFGKLSANYTLCKNEVCFSQVQLFIFSRHTIYCCIGIVYTNIIVVIICGYRLWYFIVCKWIEANKLRINRINFRTKHNFYRQKFIQKFIGIKPKPTAV